MKKTKIEKRVEKVQQILLDTLDYKLRPLQENSLKWIKEKIDEHKKYLFLDIPTGVGKSVLAIYAIKEYLEKINPDAKFDVLTSSKLLQNQYTEEFPFMNNLWGRSNYKCVEHKSNCDYGNICNKSKKTKCEECPYSEAKSKWLDGKISLTNFHMLGIYSLFTPEFLELRKSKVLIIDESHLFEQTLNDFVTFIITRRTWRNLILDNLDKDYEVQLAKMDTLEEMAKWIENTMILDLQKSELKHRAQLNYIKDKKEWDIKLKVIKNIEELLTKLNKFLSDYKGKISEWIVDKKIIKGEITWTIQPLWTGDILKNLWANYSLVIFMSGTIINKQTFSFLNGVPEEQSAYLNCSSPFDASKRPIYYYPQGRLSYKSKEESWNNYIPAIKQIMKKYKGKKGIIHTNSYEFLEYIKRDISDERFIFVESDKRDVYLQEHINRIDDCVLVSASMTEGVDLKDDLSRFQIILKVPYPSLASKVNQTRLNVKPSWYSLKTIQTLIQSYGRSVRNENDYCDTFILDTCFGDLLSSNSHMFPSYFLDAIKRLKK